MAHELDTKADGTAAMFSVRETPWHELGRVLASAPRTVVEAMEAAGLDWAVVKRPISLMDSAFPIEGHVATVRQTDGRVLGVVGEGWEPVQNVQAFEWFEPVIEDGRATFETAGALRGGRVVWVMARLAETFDVVPGDAVRPYLLLSNSHDGSRSVEARFTPIRVVCANTLGMADRGGELDRPIRIRHTKSVHDELREAQRVMGLVARQAMDTADAFRLIAGVQLTTARADELLRQVIPDNPKAARHTRTQKTRAEVMRLFEGAGLGLDLPGVRGTAWGLYNAVTDFVDYHRGVGTERGKTDARLDSIAFGSGQELKRAALAACLAAV